MFIGDQMKKILTMLFFIALIVMLNGCSQKNYDALYDDYAEYLEEQQASYEYYIEFVKDLTNVTLKSVASIQSNYIYESIQNLGSGAVIDEDETNYYILTNSHVVIYNELEANEYIVKNYLNESVYAELLFSDQDYDLALLKVDKSVEFLPIELDTTPIDISENLIVIGYPNGQKHAVTLGYYIDSTKITVSDETSLVNKVTFDVIVTNIPVKSGSSGSAMLNQDKKLIGLIYAGKFQTTEDVSTYSYAIPASKILEFLNENGYGGLNI